MANASLNLPPSTSWESSTIDDKFFYSCLDAGDGDIRASLSCTPNTLHENRDWCQVVIAYTKSWQPIGDALVFFNDSDLPVHRLAGFESTWRDEGLEYTLEVVTDFSDQTLQIPLGITNISIRCSGESSAPADVPSIENGLARTLFRLHFVVMI